MKQPDEITQEDIDEVMEHLADNARKDIIPKMRSSVFCMAVVVPKDDVDPYLALQVGVALLLEKPLIIVATGNVWIPARVRQIADAVVEADAVNDELKERLQLAILKVMEARKVAAV
jgi:hypothetical protein